MKWILPAALLGLALAMLAPPVAALAPTAAVLAPADDLEDRLRRLSTLELDEVMWLARCIYSESNRADEQRLVAWVVRNRVETSYRGSSYREVILKPLQFSAFNRDTPRRRQLFALNARSEGKAWKQALRVALGVYKAPSAERPFAQATRHFYSPVSMVGGRTPAWAKDMEPIDVSAYEIDPNRFRFFDYVDTAGDPYVEAELAEPVPTTSDQIAERHAESRSRVTRMRSRARRLSGRVRRPARPRSSRN